MPVVESCGRQADVFSIRQFTERLSGRLLSGRLSNLFFRRLLSNGPLTCGNRMTKVAPREFPARSRLQVALERERGFLLVELDDYEGSPWAVLRRMP